MEDCIFCKIIKKDIPSFIIYEDDKLIVFLDIKPSTNGDLLLIPKKHQCDILEIEGDFINHALNIIKEKIYPLLKEKLHCDGLTLVQNNGYGQDIKHFHIHLTPRYIDDGLRHVFNKEQLLPLEDIFNKLK